MVRVFGGRRSGGGGVNRSSSNSSSRFASGDDDDGLVRTAAAISRPSSGTSSSSPSHRLSDSESEVAAYENCRMLVWKLEACRDLFGKDEWYCHEYLQQLENSCAKYKSQWRDWWENDLRKSYCSFRRGVYKTCVEKRGKDDTSCTWLKERLDHVCRSHG